MDVHVSHCCDGLLEVHAGIRLLQCMKKHSFLDGRELVGGFWVLDLACARGLSCRVRLVYSLFRDSPCLHTSSTSSLQERPDARPLRADAVFFIRGFFQRLEAIAVLGPGIRDAGLVTASPEDCRRPVVQFLALLPAHPRSAYEGSRSDRLECRWA